MADAMTHIARDGRRDRLYRQYRQFIGREQYAEAYKVAQEVDSIGTGYFTGSSNLVEDHISKYGEPKEKATE